MNITVVTVTYGNRFHFLKKVITRSFEEGIRKVIVVDNNSDKTSREQLKEYEKTLGKERLQVLYLDDNYGSAGGFKRGLEAAYEDSEAEYILVLDDDNCLVNQSINKVKNITTYLENLNKNYVLSFFRNERDDNISVIKEGWIKGYKPNNFCGINFFTLIKNKLFPKRKKTLINLFPLQPIEVTAMGGSFFHKSILEKNGYPNEDFYLYADDHDFFYRFTESGGHIFLCSELKLKDLDSTNISEEGKNIGYFDKEFSEFKMYYQIRNHTYFSKKFIKSKVLFYGNLFFYLILYFRKIFITPKKLFLRRYSLMLRAIKDGLNEKLGRDFPKN